MFQSIKRTDILPVSSKWQASLFFPIRQLASPACPLDLGQSDRFSWGDVCSLQRVQRFLRPVLARTGSSRKQSTFRKKEVEREKEEKGARTGPTAGRHARLTRLHRRSGLNLEFKVSLLMLSRSEKYILRHGAKLHACLRFRKSVTYFTNRTHLFLREAQTPISFHQIELYRLSCTIIINSSR